MNIRELMNACFLRRVGALSAPILLGLAMTQAVSPAAAEISTNLYVREE